MSYWCPYERHSFDIDLSTNTFFGPFGAKLTMLALLFTNLSVFFSMIYTPHLRFYGHCRSIETRHQPQEDYGLPEVDHRS